MNLSEPTIRKITALLLEQFLEKQRVLGDAEVTLASVSTSWESLLNFQGYALPSEDGKAPSAIIVYDATAHKRVMADCERNRDEAKAAAAAAYAELLEVLNA